jgi:hypothetical protein
MKTWSDKIPVIDRSGVDVDKAQKKKGPRKKGRRLCTLKIP